MQPCVFRRQLETVCNGGDTSKNLQWSNPLRRQFLRKGGGQLKVISLQPNVVAFLKFDVSAVGIGVSLHRSCGLLQVAPYGCYDIMTIRNKVHRTLNLAVLQTRKSLIQRNTNILLVHNLKRREFGGTMDRIVHSKFAMSQLLVPIILTRRNVTT